MGIILNNMKYNSNFFDEGSDFIKKYLEKRRDENEREERNNDNYDNNNDKDERDNDNYENDNYNDQSNNNNQYYQENNNNINSESQSQGQVSNSGGGSGFSPIDLNNQNTKPQEEDKPIFDAMNIIKDKIFIACCCGLVGLIILFFVLKYLINHRKKPDLSKNFNRNYTKARDIIKHPDADESYSFDSRDESSSENLYRIESTDSMVKMFHSSDITYERNNSNMTNGSMVNLSQISKNVAPLTPAHLMSNQKSSNDLSNPHPIQNIISSSSSISSQDSRSLVNGTMKPQRRSRTNSSRGKANSNYYMSSDFVMTPFITKKIPGLDNDLPQEEEFVDYPPTPLPESLDDIPYSDNPDIDTYSDNPDIDSEDNEGIIPPEEQNIYKKPQSLPENNSSSNIISQSQVPLQTVRRESQQIMTKQSPTSQAPARVQSQLIATQQLQSNIYRESTPTNRVSQSVQQTINSQQSPPPTPARIQSQTVTSQQQQMMVNRLPPQSILQQIPPIQTRTPQQTPNRIPSNPIPQKSPVHIQAYQFPNRRQSATSSQQFSQSMSNQYNQMETPTSPKKQTIKAQAQSPKSPQPYRISQNGLPPKPQPRMSSMMDQVNIISRQSSRKSSNGINFELSREKELSFEEEMLASFEKLNSSYENLENINSSNLRDIHTKQVI
ncbi:hypothetical protein BCR36DRAFT_580694 [Piromyces finnis]|uniref:Uncharacterized protein n=1 Tax=Piromyces finnis TaxID=1754191 RepID=A0A1Y1VJS7_9FUNG|nr:hypothetical protein BCR36DRAFT_580694 [Piromyces finnis]|eukprot:ORX57281.1 hypothetical protein BCR36DRAFT_580694 [Piromyces finnis]